MSDEIITEPNSIPVDHIIQQAPEDEAVTPDASAHTETSMVAAYTDDGKYRAYTVSDWDSFTDAQKAKLQPVGVQLTAKGQHSS